MTQVVGAACAVCQQRIVLLRDGQSCPSCGAALHLACGAPHTCASVAAPAAAGGATSPRPRSRAWNLAGAVLGVAVAAVATSFVRGRPSELLLRRAARDLGCPSAELTVRRGHPLRVEGCGKQATYLQLCGAPRDECLEGPITDARAPAETASAPAAPSSASASEMPGPAELASLPLPPFPGSQVKSFGWLRNQASGRAYTMLVTGPGSLDEVVAHYLAAVRKVDPEAAVERPRAGQAKIRSRKALADVFVQQDTDGKTAVVNAMFGVAL
jgi:hypothetical protein